MEISRATNFLLERGATAFIKLYSLNYFVSPLLEGWLEIPCCVEMQMPPTLKSREIIDLYKSLIDLSFDSCEKDFVAGSFLSTNEEIDSTLAACSYSVSKKKKIGKGNPQHEKFGLFSMLHQLLVARGEDMIQIRKLFVKLSLLMTKK